MGTWISLNNNQLFHFIVVLCRLGKCYWSTPPPDSDLDKCFQQIYAGLSMIAISSVKGYYGYSLSAWIYGVALGKKCFLLYHFTELLRFPQTWEKSGKSYAWVMIHRFFFTWGFLEMSLNASVVGLSSKLCRQVVWDFYFGGPVHRVVR